MLVFILFQENRNTSKGLEIVNLESSPTYDSLTSQRAIVTWFKDFFKDSLTFPAWKNWWNWKTWGSFSKNFC